MCTIHPSSNIRDATNLEVQPRRLAAVAVALQASKVLGELQNVVRIPGEVYPAVVRESAVVRHLFGGGSDRQADSKTRAQTTSAEIKLQGVEGQFVSGARASGSFPIENETRSRLDSTQQQQLLRTISRTMEEQPRFQRI